MKLCIDCTHYAQMWGGASHVCHFFISPVDGQPENRSCEKEREGNQLTQGEKCGHGGRYFESKKSEEK